MNNKKINYTKQGYSYIECDKQDCFNWGGAAICDGCGNNMNDKVYLIYVLNSAYCPECFEEWKNHATKFVEDIDLQNQFDIRYYKAHGIEVYR